MFLFWNVVAGKGQKWSQIFKGIVGGLAHAVIMNYH